jgi:hypothetical protein
MKMIQKYVSEKKQSNVVILIFSRGKFQVRLGLEPMTYGNTAPSALGANMSRMVLWTATFRHDT